MRVLLTGAEGFTGRHLRPLLEDQGYEVIGMSDVGAPGRHGVDLRDAAAVATFVAAARPTHVVHLAAISHVDGDDQAGLYTTNVVGTVNLLEALSRLDEAPRQIVIASTGNIYGNTPLDRIPETKPPAPMNHYAASKLAMEAAVRVFGLRMPCVITRPFNYTGPGQDARFLVPKIVRHFAQRASRIELGNLAVERDFLDVRKVAATYASLLGCAAASGQTLNLCSGTGIALLEIVHRLEALTGHRIDVVSNPDFQRVGEIQRLVGSNDTLVTLLPGWRPDFDLDVTLRDMLDAVAAEDAPETH